MVKEIERYGIPIVHMATITTISESVGANRIVPTVAIPHPVGNPGLNSEDHKNNTFRISFSKGDRGTLLLSPFSATL
jgi:glycine/betaine/sarcosine/D-proline reductase family selenoprotein B